MECEDCRYSIAEVSREQGNEYISDDIPLKNGRQTKYEILRAEPHQRMSQRSYWRGCLGSVSHFCCEVSPPETTTQMFLKQKKSLLPASGCMGNLPKLYCPEPYSSDLFIPTSQVSHLISRTTEARKQDLFIFLELWTRLMDRVFVLIWASVGAYILSFKVRMVFLTWNHLTHICPGTVNYTAFTCSF